MLLLPETFGLHKALSSSETVEDSPSVRPSASKSAASNARIFVKFEIRDF